MLENINFQNRQMKQRRSDGCDMSLIHTVEQKQDMMSHKMDASIKDAVMTKRVLALVLLCFVFLLFLK